MNSLQRTVLIVDDDSQILGLVEKMLRPQGVTVLSANRPSEALRICEAQPVDLLISDVMMPEMDGGKLAERVTPSLSCKVRAEIAARRAGPVDLGAAEGACRGEAPECAFSAEAILPVGAGSGVAGVVGDGVIISRR